MTTKEFNKEIKELKLNRIALFTDEIRNSELYRKLNGDSELPEKLSELSKACNEFTSKIAHSERQLTSEQMVSLITELNELFNSIKQLIGSIDWN